MIECEPRLNALVENVAWPLLKLPVPKVVAPSLKVTVPVGVPVAGEVALTVAVNVTLWPTTAGFAEGETEVVVSPVLTVWLNVELVLVLKLLSPP